MAVGSIIFIQHSSPISWLIKIVTKSKYSHCCLSLSDDNSVIVQIDIFKRLKIIRNPYAQYDVVDFELAYSQKRQMISYIFKKLNSEYDILLDVGILMKFLGIIKSLKWWNRKDRLMCSELVNDAYLKMGISLTDIEYPTPGDLARSLKKYIKSVNAKERLNDAL